MQVDYDEYGRRFKIQEQAYGPVTIVNYSNPFDSFDVVDDELVVRYQGTVVARFGPDGRQRW